MFRKILKIVGWIVLSAFLIFTLAFTSKETNNVKCEEIVVLYAGRQAISTGKEDIINIVKSIDGKIIGKNIMQLNAEFIEQEIRKNQTIENVEVYKTIISKGYKYKGLLTVKVKHREPVLRVMSGEEEYFLDKYMAKIPVSAKYAVNVPVATGQIKPEFASVLLVPLASYIENDSFLRAQIEQIYVLENQELILTPLIGDYKIEFGSVDDYQDKLNNLKAFYENVLALNNWNKYKSINLKYKNQVIGTKR